MWRVVVRDSRDSASPTIRPVLSRRPRLAGASAAPPPWGTRRQRPAGTHGAWDGLYRGAWYSLDAREQIPPSTSTRSC